MAGVVVVAGLFLAGWWRAHVARSPAPDSASVATPTRTDEGVRRLSPAIEAALTRRLEAQEGFRDTIYLDSRGTRTVGFGHNLDIAMPRELGELILRYDFEARAADLVGLLPLVDSLAVDVRVALIDMAFQLGDDGELAFTGMVSAIRRRDWEAAARAVEDSHWDDQTRGRAEWVASVFRDQEGL